jgi:hypothetical protein
LSWRNVNYKENQMDQITAHELSIQYHQLAMPLEITLMMELEPMDYWARQVHELMYDLNPKMMIDLHSANKLISYLETQQELLSQAARQLEKQYRKQNPLSQDATHLVRTQWLNSAKEFSRQTLLSEVTQSLEALSQAQAEQQNL